MCETCDWKFDTQDLPIIEENEVVVVRHEGVSCDSCEESPICGIRFKCAGCEYDLCERCEEKEAHNMHPLLKMREPADKQVNLLQKV